MHGGRLAGVDRGRRVAGRRSRDRAPRGVELERTRVVITTEKLFIVHGTLRRRAAAVRLARLGAVEIEQSLTGRLLGYGTIVAGELEIEFVPEPRRVYGLVERLSA